ncbi:hypothetical protein LCGC14_3017460, partial [marine sediment metagenome]
MDKEIAIREEMGVVLTPAELTANATEQARLLMDIVQKTKCFQQIGGKIYLQVEAWETIGAFNLVHAETEWVRPLTDAAGETVGYEAKVNLMKHGEIVGGAVMPCFFTENACQGKSGDAKHKASMSAAQTFAESKAYRMNYAFVAILAGYQPTPAEEMGGSSAGAGIPSEHWCEEHRMNFFKKGRMKGFAHKIEGTENWCNESE